MARLNEEKKEQLRTLTVEVLLTLRRAYLQTPGKNIRKNWEILTARMRAATVTTTNPAEWFTAMLRGLKIESVSLDNSSCLVELVGAVAEAECAPEWLDLLEQEWGALLAMARTVVKLAKESAEQEKEDGTEKI